MLPPRKSIIFCVLSLFSIKRERQEFERFQDKLDKIVTAVSTAISDGDEMFIITELDVPPVK